MAESGPNGPNGSHFKFTFKIKFKTHKDIICNTYQILNFFQLLKVWIFQCHLTSHDQQSHMTTKIYICTLTQRDEWKEWKFGITFLVGKHSTKFKKMPKFSEILKKHKFALISETISDRVKPMEIWYHILCQLCQHKKNKKICQRLIIEVKLVSIYIPGDL